MDNVDKLLEKPCYIIDFLPRQVSSDSNGQFFEVETYLLNNYERYGLRDRFVRVLLKLMCYCRIELFWGGRIEKPTPVQVVDAVGKIMHCHSGTLNVLLPDEDVLVVFEWDCMHLSIYNPDAEMRELLGDIAKSEGLFWREAVW